MRGDSTWEDAFLQRPCSLQAHLTCTQALEQPSPPRWPAATSVLNLALTRCQPSQTQVRCGSLQGPSRLLSLQGHLGALVTQLLGSAKIGDLHHIVVGD